MIPHGRDEMISLAGRCSIERLPPVNGWQLDRWTLDEGATDAAIALYAAVLAGGATDPVVALLAESGLDLTSLLNDAEHSKEDITRSDLTELTAAASLVADPGCDPDQMHMPNVPKMSRRKSDSGVDIFVVEIEELSGSEDLTDGEHLTVASVKHSVDLKSTRGMRWKLAESLSSKELSAPYVTAQLRVLNARLRQEGVDSESASRVYFFLREFPHPDRIDLFAVGVVDPDLRDDLSQQIQLLPHNDEGNSRFRMILLPGLRHIDQRCP